MATSAVSYFSVADFGLMYYTARWYDPTIARFAQADTIVPEGVQGYDRYAYVNNAPTRYTDPTGHAADQGGGGGRCSDQYPCTHTGSNKNHGSNNNGNDDDPSIPHGYTVDCSLEHPCIGTGGYLPSNWTFHPLDSMVVSEEPIYDLSVAPPKLIGYRITSYAADSVDFDPSSYLPIPHDTISTGTLLYDIAKKVLKPGVDNSASVGIQIGCPVCNGLVMSISLVHDTNEAFTITAHLRTHEVYISPQPIVTPLDELPRLPVTH